MSVFVYASEWNGTEMQMAKHERESESRRIHENINAEIEPKTLTLIFNWFCKWFYDK